MSEGTTIEGVELLNKLTTHSGINIKPKVTILTRTHRLNLLSRCIASVPVMPDVYHMIVEGFGKGNNYEYNLLCNEMKAQVTSGWFFFLDDDDVLIPGALEQIIPHLTEKPMIVQMLRNGRLKPAHDVILRGHIGMPCMILHHSLKDAGDITARQSGDYDWIKTVTDKHGHDWLPIPLVDAGDRSYGR